jgi:ribosomal protein S18 acetylase RimI-like enzyme
MTAAAKNDTKIHILDNVAWNALTTGNEHLSEGNGPVRLFRADIAPFVGMQQINDENFALLHNTVQANRVVVVISQNEIEIPGTWKVQQSMKILQMVHSGGDNVLRSADVAPLSDGHVPAMLELTALTRPGPFLQGTIKFGGYHGIFDGDKLVAMTGLRMFAGQYREVSAVCTHPDYLGRGYAGKLIRDTVNLIYSQDCIPFLHVKSGNENAIRLYHHLGFKTRQEMTFYVIQHL